MSSTPTDSAKRPITAEDLFQFRLVSDPQPSPDGSQVAYVVTELDKEADDYRSAIWLVSVDGGQPWQLTSSLGRDTAPRWSPDGSLVAFVSNRPYQHQPKRVEKEPDGDKPKNQEGEEKPKPQVWLIRPAGGEARQLTTQPQGAGPPGWSPDGATIAFLSASDPANDDLQGPATTEGAVADERIVRRIRYRFNGRGFLERHTHLWTIPVAGGEATRLTSGDADDDQPAWSPDGARIAFVSDRGPDRELGRRSMIYTIPAGSGEPRCLTDGEVFYYDPVWSPDGTRLAIKGHTEPSAAGAKNSNLWTLTAGGDNLTNHTAGWDRSFGDFGMSDVSAGGDERPVWSADGSAIYALASDQGTTHIYRTDLATGAVTAVTTGPRRLTALALTAGGKLVYVAGDAADPFELFIADADGDNERQLTDHNRALLDTVAFSPAEELRFTSQDGQPHLQGWIIKPPGFRADGQVKYPLILQIHGGPHAMYGQAMFHEMQLMAARGYVVLYTNPRGSAGYGEAFTTFTRARWGETDTPDILGALDAILATGFIDERRVGLTGGSYGGYLTNWIVGHSDRFKAAVTQRCVSNFHSFYGTSDVGFHFGEWEFNGNPWANADTLLKYSPISYVDRIETPLLILHSEQDLRCPIEQAEQMFTALKRLGKEVGFVRFPEENHELSRAGKPSRRLARLHHLIGWFDDRL